MPDCGRFNEWGCDGSGSSKNVRNYLIIYMHADLLFMNMSDVNVF